MCYASKALMVKGKQSSFVCSGQWPCFTTVKQHWTHCSVVNPTLHRQADVTSSPEVSKLRKSGPGLTDSSIHFTDNTAIGRDTTTQATYKVLTLDASDVLFCLVFAAFVTVIVRKFIRRTIYHLSSRPVNDKNLGTDATPTSQQDASLTEEECFSEEESMALPARKAAIKQLHSRVLNSLSREEVEEERSVCKDQLVNIFRMMQSQPDRFGPMSEEDMKQQLSEFYAEESL